MLNKIENVEAIEITDHIKDLSKLKTLKEMVKLAKEQGNTFSSPFGGTPFLTPMFGTGIGLGKPSFFGFSSGATIPFIGRGKRRVFKRPAAIKKRAPKKANVVKSAMKTRSSAPLASLIKGTRKSERLVDKEKRVTFELKEENEVEKKTKRQISLPKRALEVE